PAASRSTASASRSASRAPARSTTRRTSHPPGAAESADLQLRRQLGPAGLEVVERDGAFLVGRVELAERGEDLLLFRTRELHRLGGLDVLGPGGALLLL